MNNGTWTDPGRRTWELSLHGGPAMAVPPSDESWSPYAAPKNAATSFIKFTDSSKPTRHAAVPYTAGKALSDLSDEEIERYWNQVVAAHPEFAPPE